MEFEWDEGKSLAKLRKHGIAFAQITAFDWGSARVFADDRRDYGEDRQLARGMIGDRLFVVVFVLRGDATRLISLRKANRREKALYDSEI